MIERFIEEHSNEKCRRPHANTLVVVIISTAVGALVSSSFFRNSFQSNLKPLHQSQSIFLTQCYSVPSTQMNLTVTPKSFLSNNEIAIPYFQKAIPQPLSKFRCTGSENDIDAWKERLCVFYNTCYNKNAGRFYYFRSSLGGPKPLFYDAAKGMIFEFSGNGRGDPFVSLSAGGSTPWAPVIVKETYPTRDFTRLHSLHSLMTSRFAAVNIAHGLWEDFGSISYAMERMSIVDLNLVIMHFGKFDNTTLFQSYLKYVIPALTKNPMLQFHSYMQSFNTKYVCFDSLIVGGQLDLFPRVRIKENHGREALLYNWRSKMIQYNGFDPNFVPKSHHIILTNKSQSQWTHSGAKRHRAIVNLGAVEEFIRLTYPTISMEVVEWQTIPFNEQIAKLLNTTILITPCGGVSLILPLLPHGAHAIVMDYYVTVSAYGYQSGQSGSMEGAVLNHISHVRKQYYQVYGPQDYEFDFPGTTDAREGSSIIVNTTRLKLLIDKALEEMEP